MKEVQEEKDAKLEAYGAFGASLKRNYKEIRDDRAEAILEDAQMIYKRKIEDSEALIKRMKRDLENLMDSGVSNTTSIVQIVEFPVDAFVAKDIDYSVKIYNEEIKLSIAKKRYIYLFGGTI